MHIKNKVFWITGASSGIGKSLAIALSNYDANLILSSRNTNALEETKILCKNSKNVKVLPIDLEDYNSLTSKVNQAIAFFNRIDVLVNNGGISQRSLVKDTNISVDKRLMDINYLGTVALTKALLPHFTERKEGHFVVTTSIVGKIGTPLRSSYAATKHALHGFFDSLRAEHHKDNIAVTLVCPGFVTTNVSKNALTGNGTPQNSMDTATANGINPDRFAELMIRAIIKKKEEVYIAGAKEKLGVYAKRFFPKLLSKMIRKLSVT
ncbi:MULTISPECIES: SDR family oxidoreductase [unclassified Tenacibaculum]|uniref:SDR family oxidoreductase n=1 Tax=unclassified Tenacibaculum TaxID=2635139 RepID=UPI001F29EFB8|nr:MULTISPECIES: SDR family oxidoreductase [unclassified Tenacibaculum]MCF2875972.1 SDR family oxidoreductase [Tenacibaculum sp. Cn5-1]MCF2936047.1 SDR family oxidoreductase [Tenacibaculum sp. Cn5-34]MCG7512608.1 SDR family oxidoreductase [Tenacibaculum sp. Cn5-46]